MRILFLAGRQLPSHGVLTWQRERDSKLSGVPSHEGANPILRGPSWLHLTMIMSQRPHPQISSHWGIGCQLMNLREGGTTQSMAPHQVRAPQILRAKFYIYFKNCISLFTFVCAESSLLLAGVLWLQSGGCSLEGVRALLTVVTSLVAEHRL